MRYYLLEITSIASGQVVRSWTSHPQGPNGPADAGALQIECDLILSAFAIIGAGSDPTGGGDFGNSFIRVWGIPLQDIAQAENLSAPTGPPGPTYKVVLKGGMAQGMPLANSSQIGPMVSGYLWRAIGNWIGLDQTLDLYLTPLPASLAATRSNLPSLPANNFTFAAQPNQPFSAAINATLQAAFPGMPINIQVSPQLQYSYPVIHLAGSIQEFNDFLNKTSVSLLGAGNPGYLGVQVYLRNGTLVVSDGSTDTSSQATGGTSAPKPNTIAISFLDLIGQPTWIANNVIQVTVVARGDIFQGDKITLPVGLTTISGGAINAAPETFTGARFSSQFQGTITVQQVRQVLNYKSPQGAQWVTVLTCNQAPGPAAAAAAPANSQPAATPAPLASVGGGTGAP